MLRSLSGYINPTMCLMQTDLPLPEGPMIIEMPLSGMPRSTPSRTLFAPKAFVTPANSMASP